VTFEKPCEETPKTLLFALFDSILEFNGCLLHSEGEPAMKSNVFVRERGEQGEEQASGIRA
jgi:hypothetical protein